MTADPARATILDLLAARAEGATICPSEAARALAAGAGREDWRAFMADVHMAAERLAAEGGVRLSWQGADRTRGPYRIGRLQAGAEGSDV